MVAMISRPEGTLVAVPEADVHALAAKGYELVADATPEFIAGLPTLSPLADPIE